MYMRILMASVVLMLAIGCAKKTAKNNAAAKDETAIAKPQTPAPPPANNKKDEPNWLTDPRFKKDQPKDEPFDPKVASNKQPWGFTPPKGGWQPPNPGAQPGNPAGAQPGNAGPMPGQPQPPAPNLPAPPGMGVLQPQATPAKPQATSPATTTKFSPVDQKDMFDLQIIYHDSSLVAGQMPSSAWVFGALIEAKSPAAELVKNGSITLTGATKRESIWAFETRALWQGGYIVSPNGVETVTAEQLKARLGIR
jgi:hypothetical protein